MVNELQHLLGNPAHWIFEGITDVAFAVAAYAIGAVIPARFNPVKRWVKRHDEQEHS